MHDGRLLSKDELTLFMDYGQFDINGGLGEWDAQLDGLNHAMADPPSYSDGTTIVVLSPHQNNFDMRIVVETWSQQPPSDADRWQQVSVERLEIGPDAQIHLSSPPDMSGPDLPVPAGKYLVEISGRGFVNYGWPGDTKPGDDWRLRLWPDDGAPRPEPQRWHMPGYGMPPVVPYRPPVPQPDHIGPPASDYLPGPKLESMPDPGLLRALGIRIDSDKDADPVAAQVDRYNGGGILAGFDRDLVAAIVDLIPERQRAVAIWCTEQAFAHAGLGDRADFTAALAALRAGEPLPAAVADPARGFETFRPGDLAGDGTPLDTTETVGEATRIVFERVSRVTHPSKHYLFHDEFVHRGYAAIPALSAAADPDPLRAAIEALFAATIAHAPHPEAFHAELKLLLTQH